MKRCHRLMAAAALDPYLEFSFEKSLRKYEKTPSKRRKMDHPHAGNARPAVHSHHSACSTFHPSLQALLPENEAKEVQQEGNGVSSECDPHGTMKVAGPQRQQSTLEIAEGESKVERKSLTVSKEFFPEAAFEGEGARQLATSQSSSKQNLAESVLFPSQALQPAEKTSDEAGNGWAPFSGGRFHLSSQVFISQRWLQRAGRQQSQEEMVEELLRKRAYLSGERAVIATRLKEFMGAQ